MTTCFHLLPDFCREWIDTETLDNPFSTEPSKLGSYAAGQLQEWLEKTDIGHDFGLSGQQGLGKMMGVLVGVDENNQLGYLAAFSGKLESGTKVSGFVPPVFDTLEEGGLYKTEEEKINELNREITRMENSSDFQSCLKKLEDVKNRLALEKEDLQSRHVQAKKQRQALRDAYRAEGKKEDDPLFLALNQESARQHFEWKDFLKKQKIQIREAEAQVAVFLKEIEELKTKRRERSANLQDILFDQYSFLNARGNSKNLRQIFQPEQQESIPSGAGECTAPKLFQFAYRHSIFPVAIAEFWWGKSPSSEIRVHRHFYPACRSKCQPILRHMLEGQPVKALPDHLNPDLNQELPIIFEDDVLILVNKPAQFLSVPGKTIRDSVLTRWKTSYPQATGPLIVHRLDMSTSGIIMGAKTKEAHAFLQKQFENHTIKKRYVAILQGKLQESQGQINLPLRVDLEDRPRQLVCFTHGKQAMTYWKLMKEENGESRVHFFPVTGRTHQLRVHAAHPQGLGIPIKGDDLYGNTDERLFLHAEQIEFIHPTTGKEMKIFCPAPF